jgi:uncharacterized protein
MKIVRASNCRTTLWKNGGGSTTQIAVEPSGASLEDFDWRVSMARVAGDGPFSKFAGIDRTLAVVKGNGLSLTVGDAAPIVLDNNSASIHFPGELPTSARLLAGEITNLNVMTRRDRFEHRPRHISESTYCDFDGHDVALAVTCSGKVELCLPHERITRGRRYRDPDAYSRRPVLARTDRFGRLPSRIAAQILQSRGLRISGRTRFAIPT